jgi:hypothetical protein
MKDFKKLIYKNQAAKTVVAQLGLNLESMLSPSLSAADKHLSHNIHRCFLSLRT